MIYIKLFFEFFKIGLFSIGGGLATLPLLQEAIDKYGWMTSEQFADMIAVSESTPGPIGINMATYVGFKAGNVLGGVVATIGLVTPSVIIIILISYFFMKFNEKPVVKAGFYGLRPAVTALIAAAGFEVAKISLFNINMFLNTHDISKLFDIKAIILFIVIFIMSNKYKRHPLFYIAVAAVVGITLKF